MGCVGTIRQTRESDTFTSATNGNERKRENNARSVSSPEDLDFPMKTAFRDSTIFGTPRKQAENNALAGGKFLKCRDFASYKKLCSTSAAAGP